MRPCKQSPIIGKDAIGVKRLGLVAEVVRLRRSAKSEVLRLRLRETDPLPAGVVQAARQVTITAMMIETERRNTASSLAVLISGGLDSAILLGEALSQRPAVYPLFQQHGLHWEAVELAHLRSFLNAVQCSSLKPLEILEFPVRDLYDPAHWSLSGAKVPGAETPDEAVFLPGRNVLLLSKALLWCHLRGVPELALATLGSNPFPDATPQFFAAMEDVVNQAVGGTVRL